MSKRTSQFQTIRTEGAILPPDILRSIAALAVDGVSADSYHLPPSSKLNEAISQAWTALLAHWKAFREAREKLPAHDETGTALTNERWLLPLFKELDYGRLTTSKSPEIDGRTYSIERLYQHTPIHLIGCNLPLDRRTRGARGAATASPHSMMQEYLNRADNSLWGFLSNGLSLRILRDNVSLSRQAYVEFDVEAMFDGEVYSDFALLWMLCHQSRVEAKKAQDCWLEKWSNLARERGTRVLKDLRVGVTSAIEALGRGLIAHPKNDRLRDKLHTGALTTQDYYRQLLRIVYRLLFLFVAEDRGLLHPSDAGEGACHLFDEYYSTARLRELSRSIRGSKHGDLWHTLSLVFDALGSSTGLPQLGLPALGSFLWRRSSAADLVGPAAKSRPAVEEPVHITNDDLLSAVRALAYVQQDNVLRDVDYRNLGSEELGSVYESLLELHPVMNIEGRSFSLSVAAGHERKTTGSYYTPDSLVQCLLDSTLEPVVSERTKGLKAAEAEKAILALKVCDPACGSGHFLIAAAHRLARHLARVRTGESEPSPEDHQHALRDVIGRCIYGVDLNPMAVELCKVSLWIEAIEPGKPLSFLDHHIQCGNSLLGATPALVALGNPDDAYKPIDGDDKEVCKKLKRQNVEERRDEERGQSRFRYELPLGDGADWPRLMARIAATPDDTLDQVDEKERGVRKVIESGVYVHARFLADAWASVFFWEKTDTDLGRACPTHQYLREFARDFHHATRIVRDEVWRLRDYYRFFHWHLAFPEVFELPPKGETPEDEVAGWNGGFDVILGNPPWDTLSPDQREFFSSWVTGLRSMSPDEQQAEVAKLLADPTIAQAWASNCRDLFALVHFLKNSGVFTLYAPGNLGKGDFNVYRMFVENALRRIRTGGFVGQVVPGGLYGGANATAIRRYLLEQCELHRLFGLINTTRGWFEKVDIDRFAAFAARRGGSTKNFIALFGLTHPNELAREPVILSAETIRQLSPETLTIPDVRDLAQLTASQKMYSVFSTFGAPDAGPPYRQYQPQLHMGNDRDLFTSAPEGLPVYEGRMIDHFDHRAKNYQSGHGNSAVWNARPFGDPGKAIVPQWRVLRENMPAKLRDRCDRFRIGFADVANPRNERSLVAALIPPGVICGHTVPTFVFDDGYDWSYLPWLAIANSFAMDALVRRKLSSPHMTFTVLDSLPFPRPQLSDSLVQDVAPMVLRLICTSPEMTSYWNQMAELALVKPVPGGTIPPLALNDPAERELVRARLDAYVASCVFDLTGDELSNVMDSFGVLRRRDERAYGEFRTKRLILDALDGLSPTATDPQQSQKLVYGDVVTDILLLLHEWNSAVSILVLEPAVLLMQSDQARNAFLGYGKTTTTSDHGQPAYKIVEGIDLVYQGLVINGAIEPVGQNGYRLLKPELIADLSAENRQRARQVVAAIQNLDRPEDALAIVAEVTHDRYAVAVS